jgi:predicted Rossmann fold flavoprotein
MSPETANQSAPLTIAIIGGGAAGLMAAYFAKLHHPDDRVILIEKNTTLGAKILLSGGGRCNLTTGITDTREVLKNYPRGAGFLRTAMENFPPRAVMDWFESQGVPLKIEADQRVFPVSDNSSDPVNALIEALKELKVQFKFDHTLTDVQSNDDYNFQLIFADHPALQADRLILTTGGNAYRHTGSTGDGYSFAQKMGHRITPLAPSLASLKTAEEWAHSLSGLAFPKARITIKLPDNTYQREGAFLFTHLGLSGPAIFALSSLTAFEPFSPDRPASLFLDLFPEQTDLQLSTQLDEKIQANPNKKITNLIALFVRHSLADGLVKEILAPAFPDKNFDHVNAANLPKAIRQKIVELLKNLPLTVIGRGGGEEFVTAGGVDTEEVDPKTMESRLRRGLFFAGELLNIDGFTGGFNLQASWATGALAGESV